MQLWWAEKAWGANPSYTPEQTISYQTHLSKTPFLLAPHNKFQLLLHYWYLSRRAQEVSTMLLVQSRWRCALLGQALTRSNLYLSLIPPAGIAVMSAIVLVCCVLSPALQSVGLVPSRGWYAANPSCPKRWMYSVGTCFVQKQGSFKAEQTGPLN